MIHPGRDRWTCSRQRGGISSETIPKTGIVEKGESFDGQVFSLWVDLTPRVTSPVLLARCTWPCRLVLGLPLDRTDRVAAPGPGLPTGDRDRYVSAPRYPSSEVDSSPLNGGRNTTPPYTPSEERMQAPNSSFFSF